MTTKRTTTRSTTKPTTSVAPVANSKGARPIATKPTVPVNLLAVIRGLDTRAATYTDAKWAIVAHLLAVGFNGPEIEAGTGVKQSATSHIRKAVNGLTATKRNGLKRLAMPTATAPSDDELTVLAKVGMSYRPEVLQRTQATKVTKRAATKTGAPTKGIGAKAGLDSDSAISVKSESGDAIVRDSLAVLIETFKSEPAKAEGWLALITDALTTATADAAATIAA